MTRRVFVRDGREYRAWLPATSRRKMDLSDERIASREANARSFHPGWDERLRRAGHLLRIEDPDEGVLWFVDTRSGAKELGCTPRSLEKNLEIMRHLRALPPTLHRLVNKYGFEVQRSKEDYGDAESSTPATSPRSLPASNVTSPQEQQNINTVPAARCMSPVVEMTDCCDSGAPCGCPSLEPPARSPAPVPVEVVDEPQQRDTPMATDTDLQEYPAPAKTPEFLDRTMLRVSADMDDYVQMVAQYSRIIKSGAFAQIPGGWVPASNLGCVCSSPASTYSSNANARTIAAYLMEHEGVSDPAAIAVILGNIQQESSFNPLACQAYGGPASSLRNCPSGGVGIIQWSGSRRTALLATSNPDSLANQLAFLVGESDWRNVRECFRTQGRAIGSPSDAQSSSGSYWACARRWIRWGTAGNRGTYANNWMRSC
eukprot:m51a1_g9197 hypothetical protein (429) ;mRNA; f:100342-103464